MRISPLNSIAHSLNRSNHIRFNFFYFSSVPNWKRFTANFNELAHKLNWFSDKFCANFRSSLHTQKKVQSARSHFNRWHTCLHLQARKRFIPFLLRDQNWNTFEETNLLWKMAFQYKFQKWLWLIKANEMIDKSHLFRHLFSPLRPFCCCWNFISLILLWGGECNSSSEEWTKKKSLEKCVMKCDKLTMWLNSRCTGQVDHKTPRTACSSSCCHVDWICK